MARSTNRVYRTPDEWAGLVQAWEASGLGVRAFARDKDFSASSLYLWRKRLSEEPPDDGPEMRFVPMVLDDVSEAPEAFGWRIKTRAGVVVSMSGPSARDSLEAAIRALGEQGALQ